MSYLLDKKNQKKKFIKIFIGFFVLLIIFYFQLAIFKNLSSVVNSFFTPLVKVFNNIESNVAGTKYLFQSKKNLSLENEDLKRIQKENDLRLMNYNLVVDENTKLKEILNRKDFKIDFVLASILVKPNQSLYDTLIIDVGSQDGIKDGSLVLALGDIPIGRVSEVFEKSSKVILFSTPGEKMDVNVSGQDILMQVVGRGGGNFEMLISHDLALDSGTEVTLPGISSYIVATVAKSISDPRDSYKKMLLISPVNIQELKFVEVERNN